MIIGIFFPGWIRPEKLDLSPDDVENRLRRIERTIPWLFGLVAIFAALLVFFLFAVGAF